MRQQGHGARILNFSSNRNCHDKWMDYTAKVHRQNE
ncbi:hypothetical protein DFR34_102143 [Rivihabitans pingtungensis]|uniref:Uncharacterized protein n=1 Tax=Rivihabitans pingtungensis TaxID=1054498 RepID=A0A318KTV4_9NEIS|nr:hypothetical protein DFR34_102143 [Rivihabitans pingtungensis]